MDLSVAAQLRALREYAERNGYSVAREYVDEAESGRIADRPPVPPDAGRGWQAGGTFPGDFGLEIQFSRFTRKREHAVAFKSMLRRRGVRVVSITENAADAVVRRIFDMALQGRSILDITKTLNSDRIPPSTARSGSRVSMASRNWDIGVLTSIKKVLANWPG